MTLRIKVVAPSFKEKQITRVRNATATFLLKEKKKKSTDQGTPSGLDGGVTRVERMHTAEYNFVITHYTGDNKYTIRLRRTLSRSNHAVQTANTLA